jgi:hypothetical protein
MKTKLVLLTTLLLYSLTTYSQADIRRVAASSLPDDISKIPNISISVRWTDSTGDNVLISTGKIHRPSDDVVLQRAERGLPTKNIRDYFNTRDYFKEDIPFVYHFMLKNDTASLLWKTSGTGLSCGIDTKGNSVKSSVIVTDLNNNHIAEIWIVFKAICAEDETPNPMKIVMHEQGRRYVQTGTRVWKDGNNITGGQYWFDEAFQRAPAIYKEYADRLWKKNASD